MPGTRRAVIDVGTNSVKLLVADVQGGSVEPVTEDSEQTRLGAGFYETRRLQPEAITRTARTVAAFAARARVLRAGSIRVIATSAARDAVNPGELLSAIEQASGTKVEIISGEQEADWVYQGVTTDPRLAAQTLLLMDVGGGSTEFILGQGEQKHFRQSFSLGTVRLLEKLRPDDPPAAGQQSACRDWVKNYLLNEVRPELAPALERENKPGSERGATRLIGTGGTATILARMEGRMDDYDRIKIEALRLSIAQVRGWADRLWQHAFGGTQENHRPPLQARGRDCPRPGDIRGDNGGLWFFRTARQHAQLEVRGGVERIKPNLAPERCLFCQGRRNLTQLSASPNGAPRRKAASELTGKKIVTRLCFASRNTTEVASAIIGGHKTRNKLVFRAVIEEDNLCGFETLPPSRGSD